MKESKVITFALQTTVITDNSMEIGWANKLSIALDVIITAAKSFRGKLGSKSDLLAIEKAARSIGLRNHGDLWLYHAHKPAERVQIP